MPKFIVLILFVLITVVSAQRTEIGQHAFVRVLESNMSYLARIDSGARITSLHATHISLEGPKGLIPFKKVKKLEGHPFKTKIKNQDYRRNIGRYISFDTKTELGETKHMRAKVIAVARVRNAQGTEYRYVIRLALKYKNIVKYKEVNLRDRSRMTYKLLIGRNWLDHDFVIKTDLDIIKK